MEMYDYIRYSHHKLGHGIRKISRDTGLDRKTIRRALNGTTPEYQLANPRPKVVVGPFVDQIKEWLLQDRKAPKKQRHTAERIYQRLRDELGFQGSLSTTQVAVREVHKMHTEASAHKDKEKKLKKDLAGYSAQLESLTERLAKLPVSVPADEIYKTMRVIGEKKDKVANELEAFLTSDRLGQEVPVELKDYEQFIKAMKGLWFNPESNAELKEKIIKKSIARIEIDVDSIAIDFWMGKGFY